MNCCPTCGKRMLVERPVQMTWADRNRRAREAAKRIDDGASAAALAAEYGVHRRTVYLWVKRARAGH